MEKIKFKAWDREEKCWITNKERVCIEDDGSIAVIDFDRYDGYSIIEQDNVDICLFTGLKDKNGKEIYDGDIVSICYGDAFAIYHATRRIKNFGGFSGIGFADRDGNQNNPAWQYESIKVVGNIYENPELLEGR